MTMPAPTSPVPKSPTLIPDQGPEFSSAASIKKEQSGNEMADLWKRRSSEKDKKIRDLMAQIKKLQQDKKTLEEQTVDAVKEARAKQLEAQSHATAIYENNEELEAIKKTHLRQLAEQKALLDKAEVVSKHMSFYNKKSKEDNLALIEAIEKMKVELEQARGNMADSNVAGNETLVLATQAVRMANEELKRQVEEKESKLLEKEAELKNFREQIQAFPKSGISEEDA